MLTTRNRLSSKHYNEPKKRGLKIRQKLNHRIENNETIKMKRIPRYNNRYENITNCQ